MAAKQDTPRARATATGAITYQTGIPCKRGHTGPRFVGNRACVACQSGHAVEWRKANPEKKVARDRAYRKASPRQFAAYDQAYRKAAPEKFRAKGRVRYAANREKMIAYARAWQKANPARRSAYMSSYRAANTDKAADSMRAWRRANPERCRASEAARRARKMGARAGDRDSYVAFVKWSRTEAAIPCGWCGRITRPGKRHLDHIVPLLKGGADSVENLCVACPRCNLSKGARLPGVFALALAEAAAAKEKADAAAKSAADALALAEAGGAPKPTPGTPPEMGGAA